MDAGFDLLLNTSSPKDMTIRFVISYLPTSYGQRETLPPFIRVGHYVTFRDAQRLITVSGAVVLSAPI